MPLGRQFADELTLALRQRRIKQGLMMLDSAEAELSRITPDTPNAAGFLLLTAQWVDVGFRDYHFLEPILQHFPTPCRRKLSIDDYLRLRMVEAFRSLAAGELDYAIDTLRFVLEAQRDLPGQVPAALAHFWKGRAHRKKGEYDDSLVDIVRARELAQADHEEIFAAVIQIQESWLLFQRGETQHAVEILNKAENVLKATDYYVALGDIESARGRIVRRLGEYTNALEHFNRAVEIYARGDAHHINLARTLVNSAYVQRLLALQIRKKIDTRVQTCRLGGAPKMPPGVRESLRVRYQQICQEASQNLTRAREIYDTHRHTDGIGNVTLNLGFLHLDRGDIERATIEALESYRIGVAQDDHILMARARILETAIENAHVEEQTGEDVDVAVHANRAKEYSEEALKLAQNTQNRRLLAGAWIARGMTAANDFCQDWDTARRSAIEATNLIGPGENDHLVEDLAMLKSRIVQASGINDTLRGWSEGMVADKTFQQITEEFAEIVIPKVWVREDRKISRVATCLSISPKKVRRILRNVGAISRV